MKATFLKGVLLGAVVGSMTLVGTAAFAGTGVGGIFNLGKYNGVNGTTTLAGSTRGKQLSVVNTNSGAGATGVAIAVHNGKPPLTVNSATKVVNLNADKLDGLDSAKLQRRIQGACTHGRAMTGTAASGAVTCTGSSVFAVNESPAANVQVSSDFLPSSLRLLVACHANGNSVGIAFVNNSSSAVTLNWMFSAGGAASTVNASGAAIGAQGFLSFSFPGARLEGQWIYAQAGRVTTVNLHAFDAGTACEIRGTVEVASG
jgi:hypothetical protein